MTQVTLFERLGGRDGVRKLTQQVVANHFENPTISTRFHHAKMTQEELTDSATEFFCTGLSGVPTYEGKDMVSAHKGMNITGEELIAVLDDVMNAMKSLGHGDLEQAEVLKILYDMKPEIVNL